MHCHDARRLLDAGVSPGTSEPVRTLLGFHLAACPECRSHRRRLDDGRLLQTLMAQRLEAPRAPAARPRRRASAARAAGSAALVCGALLLGAAVQPATAAGPAAPAQHRAPGYETQRLALRHRAQAPAAQAAASREHSVYVALALGGGAAAPAAEAAPAAAPAAPVVIPPKAEPLGEAQLTPGQQIVIPALPVSAPAEQVAPQRSYTVRAGDTLSGIALSFYGDGGLWRVIYDANRESIRDPNLIYPNQTVVIPAILGQNPPVVGGPQTGAGGIYVVRSGDTLSAIALRAYGNAGAWTAIYNANRGVIGGNPNFILPGQQLQLPR